MLCARLESVSMMAILTLDSHYLQSNVLKMKTKQK